jgi:hypothetical protein
MIFSSEKLKVTGCGARIMVEGHAAQFLHDLLDATALLKSFDSTFPS